MKKKFSNFSARSKRIALFLACFFYFSNVPFLAASTSVEKRFDRELSAIQLRFLDHLGEARLAVLLERALHSYDSTENYQSIFYKTEKDEKSAARTEKIYLRFEKPWKIVMKWLNTEKKGLQVVYEKGKNDGKIGVHLPGLALGLVRVVFLDPDSPWVKQGDASHGVEDAGIGNFLMDLTESVVRASKERRLDVQLLPHEGEKSELTEKIDVTFMDAGKSSGSFAHRVVVQFDRKTNLPVWMELFDYKNVSTGVYAYRDLKVNVKDDEELKRQIDDAIYKIFRPATG